jgi:SnoaL-like domain
MSWTDVFDAWGAADADSWAALADALVSDTIYYADPHSGPIEGKEAFLGMIAQFRTMMPGGGAKARDADGYDGHARAAVEFSKGGETFMTGQFVAEMGADGRLTRLVGFSSPPTP